MIEPIVVMTLVFSHKHIVNGIEMKTTIKDIDVSLQKICNIRLKFLVHKLRLLSGNTYPDFVRIDQFLCN